MVKTPSSWAESFFICTASTCASSRIEKSLSAQQSPPHRSPNKGTNQQLNTFNLFPGSWAWIVQCDEGIKAGTNPAPSREPLAIMAEICLIVSRRSCTSARSRKEKTSLLTFTPIVGKVPLFQPRYPKHNAVRHSFGNLPKWAKPYLKVKRPRLVFFF